ncbi:MAG: serine hydrolase [Sedimentisphaerales bacterium]|nr:serine hydrolase [Sedimentisphaerales bacterium]
MTRHSVLACLMTAFFLASPSRAQSQSASTTAPGGPSTTNATFWADDLPDSEREPLERFAAELDAYRRNLHIPGMSAGVVREGWLIWARGFGFADVENEVPATPETPYHLASLTKTFASQIILKLVEKGKIDLDDPVKKYGVNIEGDNGITVRHLFTHTAEGTPGRRYKYNGYLYSFLGRVVEKASGRSFRDLVTEQILQPTGMKDTAPVVARTSLDDETSSERQENVRRVNRALARPYRLDKSLQAVPGDHPNPDHFGVSTGLISNVIDMAKYDAALDRHAFISDASQELAWTPAVANSRATLPYGLGWFVQELDGTKLVWHYGWEVNFSALILKVPQENVTFVALANTDTLSRPFGLGDGDVLNSPMAVAFLRTIAFKDRFSEPAPRIDYEAGAEAIIRQLAAVADPTLKKLLKRELIGNLSLYHNMKRQATARSLMDAYIGAFTHDGFEEIGDLPVIARIDNVTDDEYRTVPFELTKDTPVRVYAIGEGDDNAMYDYGGIENARTGELVWEMYGIATKHAGGAGKNRKVDRIVPLRAGAYRLHYRTDESHSFGNWNHLPPDHRWWGIRLFDASTSSAETTASGFWPRARCPEELGWSSRKLEALRFGLERLRSAALLIVTDGKVVFEWGRIANNVYSHSTRKSLLSALYGIYVDEGKIDPNATLGQLGIDEIVPLTEPEKQARVMDLLRARSGVYIPSAAEVTSMRNARPGRGSHNPGTHWYYNNWDFNVLGTIFRQQTGDEIFAAFGKRIAGPLRMQDYAPERQRYSYEQNFSIHPAYPFLISARDMAKLGQLFLQQGRWDGEQIIPAAWIEESTRSYSQTGTPHLGYGYMWWTATGDFYGMKDGDYYASGYGGQKLFVLPRINTLVVHRNNIYLPGVDIDYASGAPFHLMPRILEAYTGKRQPTVAASAQKPARPRRLLKDYAEIQRASAADYTAWRVTLWACAVVFASWAVLCTARSVIKRARSSRAHVNGTANGRPALVTVTRLVGSLIALACTVYLLALLLFQGALRFIAINGVPPYLPPFYSVVVYVPLLAPAAAGLSLLVTILLWARSNGTPFERAHFAAFTLALIVFTWASCTLNLMPEWR